MEFTGYIVTVSEIALGVVIAIYVVIEIEALRGWPRERKNKMSSMR